MSSTEEIRVMLVDDHPITRRGLREVMEDAGGFEIVGEATDGEEAVEMAQTVRPDVIVMDVIMPKKDGVEACRDILDLLPEVKVVILTASTEDDAVIEAIAAGATGFVQKYSGGDELVDAVRQAADGRLAFRDDVVKRAFGLIRRGAHIASDPTVLTSREQQILTHFARGKTYAAIGADLGITAVTVRNAIYRIQGKLQLPSKQEIVVWAVRNGLLDSDVGQLHSPES